MFVNARSVRRLVSGALITTAILMIFGPPKPVSAQPANGTPVIPVTVTNVVRSDVPVWLRGLGTVQANFAVQIRPRVDGALSQVPVKEGQDVKKGDLLAVIDPRTYQAALNVVTAKRQQDQAQLVNAQADLARYASLARQDFASRQQLETQQAVVKQLSAAILGDGAQVEAAQLNLSFCYILSPFDGRIGLRNVDPGNIVRSAETTSLTRPQSSAVLASRNAPDKLSCLARRIPITSGSITVRPQPGSRPTRACVSAKRARSDAMRKSQASAISKPPVTAAPLMAPITGLM